jgi:hypothetical protein
MDAPLRLLAVIAGTVGIFALLVYLMCRAVAAARKATTGAHAAGASSGSRCSDDGSVSDA